MYRFAAGALCRGARKEEVVIDLTDKGFEKVTAQQVVAEMCEVRNELRGALGRPPTEEELLARTPKKWHPVRSH
jgi:hypothetical protein